MDPINYSGMLNLVPQTQGLGGFFQGVQDRQGAMLGNQQVQNAGLQGQLLQAALAEKQEAAKQQANQDLRLAEFQKALGAAGGDMGALSNLAMQYPEQIDTLKKGIQFANEADQNSAKTTLHQTMTAISSGRPEAAVPVVQSRIKYLQATGQPSDLEQSVLQALQSGDPQQIKAVDSYLGKMALFVDPEMLKSQADIRAKNATAGKAEVETALAPKEFGLKQSAETFNQWAKRQDIEIAKLNADISRETNDLKRQEMIANRDAKMQERQQAQAERQASYESSISDIDNALGTIHELKLDPNLSGATGVTGMALRNIPGTDYYNVGAKIQTLKSQAFLASIGKMKSMGALSEQEGNKLQSSIASLDPNMSTKAFLAEVSKMENIMRIARARKEKEFGQSTPETGSVTFQGKTLSPSALREAASKAGMTVDELKARLGVQ